MGSLQYKTFTLEFNAALESWLEFNTLQEALPGLMFLQSKLNKIQSVW